MDFAKRQTWKLVMKLEQNVQHCAWKLFLSKAQDSAFAAFLAEAAKCTARLPAPILASGLQVDEPGSGNQKAAAEATGFSHHSSRAAGFPTARTGA